MKSFERVYDLPPAAARAPVTDPSGLARDVATLGYELFAYLKGRSKPSPERTLLTALLSKDLEARLAEALPWVALTYPDLNWDWLVDRAKRHDAQNRLGFVVTLARELAERREDSRAVTRLRDQEKRLERSLLAREDTLAHESMTRTEREWLRARRPEQARRWHVLTDLTAENLPYAS